MKNYFLLLTLLLINLSCSQTTKNITLNMEQNSDITSKNIIERVTQAVKRYDKEPRYYIKISNQNCFSEILVNDIPVFQNFNNNNFTTTEEISHLMFKNGEQKITYRMYSLGEWQGDKFPVFNHNSELTIRVDKQDNRDLDDEDILMTSSNENVIGKSFYEKTFVFNAKVPYVLENFEEAQDLRKIERKELEKNVIKRYSEIKTLIQNHNIDFVSKMYYKNIKNQATSEYMTSDNISEIWKEISDVVQNKTLEVQPLENYKMIFYNDGKLVGLISNSSNVNLKNKSALWAKFQNANESNGYIFGIYLYLPKGKTEFEIY